MGVLCTDGVPVHMMISMFGDFYKFSAVWHIFIKRSVWI